MTEEVNSHVTSTVCLCILHEKKNQKKSIYKNRKYTCVGDHVTDPNTSTCTGAGLIVTIVKGGQYPEIALHVCCRNSFKERGNVGLVRYRRV